MKNLILIFLMTIGMMTSIHAQKEMEKLLAANDELSKAVVSGDSALFFSITTPDFRIINGSNGTDLERNEVWKWWTSRVPPGLKAAGEVTSKRIEGSVAWLTYKYTFAPNDKTKKIVTTVENYKDYEWIGTGIFVKQGNKWLGALWHTSPVPRN